MPPHQVHDIRRFDPAGLDPDGAFVVVCRYASKPLLAWIEAMLTVWPASVCCPTTISMR